MKEVTFEESRRIQLSILCYFDAFCREHQLRYSLGEGTLIGAVRHKGFIPWDDDIDVIMLREDYDRFLSIYDGDKYSLKSIKSEQNWRDCYSRLSDNSTCVYWELTPTITNHGIWVAIFPVDNIPDDDVEWNRMKQRSRLLQMLCCAKYTDSMFNSKRARFIKPLIQFYSSIHSANYFVKKAEKTICKYKGISTKRRTVLAIWWATYPAFRSEVFDEYIEMEFEGHNFLVLKYYDEYLRGQYGDYMTLPPVESRVPQHHMKAYWKD